MTTVDKIKLKEIGLQDKRVKLTPEQKEEIRIKYELGGYSQRALADEYGVSRRTIKFIIDPDSLERAKQQYRERRKDGRYYNREKHSKAVKELRIRKRIALGLV